MKFKEKIIQEFGEYIYKDKNGEYAIESDSVFFRPCFVYLKNGFISCKGSNIIKQNSFKQCYFILKQGIYQKVSN